MENLDLSFLVSFFGWENFLNHTKRHSDLDYVIWPIIWILLSWWRELVSNAKLPSPFTWCANNMIQFYCEEFVGCLVMLLSKRETFDLQGYQDLWDSRLIWNFLVGAYWKFSFFGIMFYIVIGYHKYHLVYEGFNQCQQIPEDQQVAM